MICEKVVSPLPVNSGQRTPLGTHSESHSGGTQTCSRASAKSWIGTAVASHCLSLARRQAPDRIVHDNPIYNISISLYNSNDSKTSWSCVPVETKHVTLSHTKRRKLAVCLAVQTESQRGTRMHEDHEV